MKKPSKPCTLCAVPENMHTHPRRVNGNSKGEGGSKAQVFEGKYDYKMEFAEGWGVTS